MAKLLSKNVMAFCHVLISSSLKLHLNFLSALYCTKSQKVHLTVLSVNSKNNRLCFSVCVRTLVTIYLYTVDKSKYYATVSLGWWLHRDMTVRLLKCNCSWQMRTTAQDTISTAKASTPKDTNPPSGQSHFRDYAAMWNGIWRQRQESETSVWRTLLTSTSLFAAHSSKYLTDAPGSMSQSPTRTQ